MAIELRCDPVRKISLYRINEDGTVSVKKVPISGGTITYDIRRDMADGWMAEAAYKRLAFYRTGETPKTKASANSEEVMAFAKANGFIKQESPPVEKRKRGRPRKNQQSEGVILGG